MRGRPIQKSDGSREEAVIELVGMCPQTFVSFSRRKKVITIGFMVGDIGGMSEVGSLLREWLGCGMDCLL